MMPGITINASFQKQAAPNPEQENAICMHIRYKLSSATILTDKAAECALLQTGGPVAGTDLETRARAGQLAGKALPLSAEAVW